MLMWQMYCFIIEWIKQIQPAEGEFAVQPLMTSNGLITVQGLRAGEVYQYSGVQTSNSTPNHLSVTTNQISTPACPTSKWMNEWMNPASKGSFGEVMNDKIKL